MDEMRMIMAIDNAMDKVRRLAEEDSAFERMSPFARALWIDGLGEEDDS